MIYLQRSLRQFGFLLFVVAISLLSIWLYAQLHLSTVTTPMITEASYANNEKKDWIEIYNPSLNSISLKGYYLSDDMDDLKRYQFTEDVLIGAHSTVIIFGKNADDLPRGSVKTNFNLSQGETLVLTAPNGYDILDRMALIGPTDFQGAFTLGRTLATPTLTEVLYQPTPGRVQGMATVAPGVNQ